jgi:hypothetical protein
MTWTNPILETEKASKFKPSRPCSDVFLKYFSENARHKAEGRAKNVKQHIGLHKIKEKCLWGKGKKAGRSWEGKKVRPHHNFGFSPHPYPIISTLPLSSQLNSAGCSAVTRS